jgi:heat shock protein HspQ
MEKSKAISEQNILNDLKDIYIPKPSIGDLFIYKEKPMAQ